MSNDKSKEFLKANIDKKIEEFLNVQGKLSSEQISLLHLMIKEVKDEDVEKYKILEFIRINKS